ncbi:MAG: serine/threonine-protein kinase [Luteolibacter sp.]
MSEASTQSSFRAPEPSELAPMFPSYHIDCLIATGGMGAVYRALQKSLDRMVAIKILPQEFSQDAAFCESFEAEAKAMARLNHPNLIGVYDFGEVSGMLFIIMEYVDGKSLFHSSHGLAIDPNETIRLVSGICSGLAHAHEHGIIHRDIKPSNILLDLQARPKIGDFGLARPVDRKIQEGEEIFGTPHYTAPEVVNSPMAIDHHADIFSVGVMLHELLTGKLPADDPRPASAIVQCHPKFDAIIRRATDPNPALRYPSAQMLCEDLESIANAPAQRILRTAQPKRAGQGSPIPARPAVLPGEKSSNAPVILVLSVLVAAAAAVLWYLSQPDEAQDTPENVGTMPAIQPDLDSSPLPPGLSVSPPSTPSPKPPESVAKQDPVSPPPERPSPSPQQPVEPTQIEPEVEPEVQPPPLPPIKETEQAPPNPSPDPKPEPPAFAESTFDIQAFFDRAHEIMRDKAASRLAQHQRAIDESFDNYEKGLKRITREIENRDLRRMAEDRFS